MDKLKKTQFGLFASIGIICLVSVLAIGVVAFAYYGEAPKVVNESGGIVNYNEAQLQPQEQGRVEEELGAAAGTRHYFPERFYAGFGGAVLATSTSGTATTLREHDLVDNSVIQITPNVASFTYTLPATSTLTTLLKNVGDTQSWIFKNATTTAATTLTLAKGNGWDLIGYDADVDVIAGAAVGSEVYLKADCTRILTITNEKDIVCFLTKSIAVD